MKLLKRYKAGSKTRIVNLINLANNLSLEPWKGLGFFPVKKGSTRMWAFLARSWHMQSFSGQNIQVIFPGPAFDGRPLQTDPPASNIREVEQKMIDRSNLVDISAGQEQQVSRSSWCTAQFPIILVYVGSKEPCTNKCKLKCVERY